MKITTKPLGLLGLSIGIGSVLSLTPMDLVHAGSFSKDITYDGGSIGHVEFTWDDEKVSGSSITNFKLLESFSFTEKKSGMEYDLDFVMNQAYIRFIDFDLEKQVLNRAEAYKFAKNKSNAPTGKIGFRIKRMEDVEDGIFSASIPVNAETASIPVNAETASIPVNAETEEHYIANFDLSQHNNTIEPVVLEEAENNESIASVPENNFAAALLMIASFVLIGSKKAF